MPTYNQMTLTCPRPPSALRKRVQGTRAGQGPVLIALRATKCDEDQLEGGRFCPRPSGAKAPRGINPALQEVFGGAPHPSRQRRNPDEQSRMLRCVGDGHARDDEDNSILLRHFRRPSYNRGDESRAFELGTGGCDRRRISAGYILPEPQHRACGEENRRYEQPDLAP